MAVYSLNGEQIYNVYNLSPLSLNQAYDIQGNELLSGGSAPSDEFVKTILSYDTNYIISNAWLANATTQRNALLTAFNATGDGIPFFIQTDGHGRLNEGNKGCHNLAEETMGYIRNIQLGDYGSYYSDGANARKHLNTSLGISKYICAMGNHEFLNNNSDTAELADLEVLSASFIPSGAITDEYGEYYGYYKVIDTTYNVKYLVMQNYIPDADNSKGFISKIVSEQWDWLIDELETNDGYDIVVLRHAPFGGTYTRTSDLSTATYTSEVDPLLTARKAKQSGSITDDEGGLHPYDFTTCTSDLLCTLHGHLHKEEYKSKSQFGYPSYVADWFGNAYTCCYGLIDRANGKLKFWKFSNSTVADVLELDL